MYSEPAKMFDELTGSCGKLAFRPLINSVTADCDPNCILSSYKNVGNWRGKRLYKWTVTPTEHFKFAPEYSFN